MRTVSATLATAQGMSTGKRTPYIKLLFTLPDTTTVDLSTDSGTYGNRILGIDAHEASYADFAYITIQDYARTIPDLRGAWVEIGFGDTTGSGNEYSQIPRLWVTAQETVYASNKAIIVLELEGMWSILAKLQAMFAPITDYNPSIIYGNYPAGDGYDARSDFGVDASLYTILEYAIETMTNLSTYNFLLNAIGSVDDGRINESGAIFPVYQGEYCDSVIRRLMALTYCVLRPETSLAFTVLYPRAEDATDITFYNNQVPYFYQFNNKTSYTVPNYVILFYNGADNWTNKLAITDVYDSESINALGKTYYYFVWEADVTSATMARHDAQSYLYRFGLEKDAGSLIVPHDCRIQLYDKIAVQVV